MNRITERVVKIWVKIWRTFAQLWSIKHARRKIVATPLCALGAFFIYSCAAYGNSCALSAFTCLIIFDVLTLIGDLINYFYTHAGKPGTSFSFGFVRVEILIHFTVLCMGLLLNLWSIKVGAELLATGANQEIHTGRFIPAVVVGSTVHFFLSFHNNPFLAVSKFSGTCTSLQKYFQGIFGSFGCSLSSPSILLFSQSPLAILGGFSSLIILVLSFALQTGPRWMDLVGGVLIVLGMFDTLWPLCYYIGQVLLQSVPAHTVGQLDKALREALTIDGVLEFRNELFWTLSYGQIAGSLHVRVRRDANEQFVLSQVYEKLHPLAPHLTVQITKDDFGRNFEPLHHLVQVGRPPTSTIINLDNFSEISPIPASHNAGKHIIYSTASCAGSNSKPSRHTNNYNSVINLASSTKIVSNELYGENDDETVLNISNDTSLGSILSSTTSSVFPNNSEPPTTMMINKCNFDK